MSLEEAQERAFDDFVNVNQRSALLPDVINTIKSGLPAILRQLIKHKGSGKIIMPRFDSGDVPAQCLYWKRMTLDAGFKETQMVVEDGYNPTKGRETKRIYAAAGFNPKDIIVGAGGYFQEGCMRDAASLVDKRGATEHDEVLESSMKFSDSVGKSSIPGQIRIYERDRTLIVAQAGESIDGKLVSVKLVENGRIVYLENLDVQKQRADRTWDLYTNIEYSPLTQRLIDERTAEYKQIIARADMDFTTKFLQEENK